MIMKAKITFKDSKISITTEIECIHSYTISFYLEDKFHNPITFKLLCNLGASVAKMHDGSIWVCISKRDVEIEFV